MEFGIGSDDGGADDGDPLSRSMHEGSQKVEQIVAACRKEGMHRAMNGMQYERIYRNMGATRMQPWGALHWQRQAKTKNQKPKNMQQRNVRLTGSEKKIDS